jgi:hypothetical protein
MASTLIKWFPDQAAAWLPGMAIMVLAGVNDRPSPLAAGPDEAATPTDVGVMQTFVVMALILCSWDAGAAYRVPENSAAWA